MPAGYRLYGGSAAEFVVEAPTGGTPGPGSLLALPLNPVTLTVWDTAGVQILDLLDAAELPVTVLLVTGNFSFWAPNTLGSLWVSTDAGVTLYVVHPADTGGRLLGLETGVADLNQTLTDVPVLPTRPVVKSALVWDPVLGAGTGGLGWRSLDQFGGAVDTTPPAAPSSVGATAPNPTTVTVTWAAATDNVAVAGYRVLLNGSQVGGDLPGTARSYTYTGAVAATAYTPSVVAFDGEGNVSGPGVGAAVTTPAAPSAYDTNGFALGGLALSKADYTTAETANVTATITHDPAALDIALDEWGVDVREVDPATNAVISPDDASIDFPHQPAQNTSTWPGDQKLFTGSRALAGGPVGTPRKYRSQVWYKVTGKSGYPRVGAPVYFTVTTATVPGGGGGGGGTAGRDGVIPAVPADGWFSGGSGAAIDTNTSGAFAGWRGRPIEYLCHWADGANGATWGFPGLDSGQPAFGFTGLLDIAIGGPSDYTAARNGSMDASFREAMILLRSKRTIGGQLRATAVRAFHEWNGNYAWAVSPGEMDAFRATQVRWRNICADVYPEALWEFCPNAESYGVSALNWTTGWVDSFTYTGPSNAFFTNGQAYPVNDLHATDRYNQFPPVTQASEWEVVSRSTDGWGAPKGWGAHLAFAQSKGVPMCFPEYAGNGDLGDYPAFIVAFLEWVKANAGNTAGKVLAEGYFNQTSEAKWPVYPTTKQPQLAAAYRNFFLTN